jgi:hypothetical protein
MHNPGICGLILPSPVPAERPGDEAHSQAAELAALIAELNAASDLVLVVLRAGDESLAPTVWAQAAYTVTLAPESDEGAALRAALQEVLNRGRDTALVASPGCGPLAAATLQSIVEAYCAAGDEIWAVIAGNDLRGTQPMLLGRNMIEVMLRSRSWHAAEEVLAANLAHVLRLAAAESIA